ncbi:hypothetical protein BT93_E2386 [Corymbia citriodora subsp. variegata]|nr:hypothetical protein BT93_E2386 [Corymbia citriodora subsp. variegata]
MSLQISAVPSPSPAHQTSRLAERRSRNFNPSIWGDYFLKYTSDSNSMKLNLIDQIQRLGLAYHFETEIDEQLEQLHKSYFEFHHGNNDDDLHTIALLFRLLRQQGYNVSCVIFNKFKDNKGNFNKSLITDVQGLLSLFEACHLGFHGDDILNDALAFTITHLESIDKGKVRPTLQKQILLSLAKLDFNLLQEQHQKELGHITRWWKDLNVERKFPFARDRLVEAYFWMSAIYFELEYEATREILTKTNVIFSIMDDLYDGYGTSEELELFTEAIERWDVDAKEKLPEYMQLFYQTVLGLYDEIGSEMTRKEQSYRLFYAKEVEYMPVASVTIGCEFNMVTSLLRMGDTTTKNDFDWLLFSDPKMVKATNVVCRLMNDIAGYKSEQERGDAASSVECFMKQYGVTEEEAMEVLRKQVVDAWKDINEELCHPTAVPTFLLVRILNYSRTFHVIYNDEKDHYSHAGTRFKELVTSLLVNPLPI